MPHITSRLSVEGPDREGRYWLIASATYVGQIVRVPLTRAEADALIAALAPATLQLFVRCEKCDGKGFVVSEDEEEDNCACERGFVPLPAPPSTGTEQGGT